MTQPIFSPWTVQIRYWIPIVAAVVPIYLIALMFYGGHPQSTHKNYMPSQPVPFSHQLHAGQMKLDCRYCHNTVEQAGHAAVPPTATCMGCHINVKTDSPRLAPVRDSWATGQPVDWVRVHHLPDYVYFNHSVHVARGIGCATCHGPVDKMEKVYTFSDLSMGWCLDCHRNPEQFVRPVEEITNMDWDLQMPAAERQRIGRELVEQNHIYPATSCSTCHR